MGTLAQRVKALEEEVARLRGEPPIVPEGTHRVRIVDLDLRTTRAGKSMVSIKCDIADDEYDRSVWLNLVEGAEVFVGVRHGTYTDRPMPTVNRLSWGSP